MQVTNLEYKVGNLQKKNAELKKELEQREHSSSQTLESSETLSVEKKEDIFIEPVIIPTREWTEKEMKMAKGVMNNLEKGKKKRASNSNEIVGTKFPLAQFVNSNGEIIHLRESLPNKKILLVILRGFAGSVCLVCSSQTIALSKNIDKFREKNTEVVLVYPGKMEAIPHFIASVQSMEEDTELPFPILLDVSLGLVNSFKISGSLAKPTSILIDENDIIRYAYVGKHPGDRPTIENLLQIIDPAKN